MTITVGRGFCLGEDSKDEGQPIGMINVDALYSPVKLVKYDVQNTRVGQMTDYDKLILEVNTDGRISPDDALKQSAAILRHHLDVFDQISEEQIEFEAPENVVNMAAPKAGGSLSIGNSGFARDSDYILWLRNIDRYVI
jgi:DNA-directed RNA polymerase subunit alpha